MIKNGPVKVVLFLGLSFFLAQNLSSQTCSGTLGEPIFKEDFGKNIVSRTQLGSTGTTTYCFDRIGCTGGTALGNLPANCTGSGSTPTREQIDDNEYTILGDIDPVTITNTYNGSCGSASNIGNSHPLNSGWHNNIEDHTAGDTNGGMAVFNAALTANEFFRRTITGLCGGTTFEFSAWLANMYDPGTNICSNNGGNGLPVNVLFEVRNPITNALISSVSSGNIQGSNTFTWAKHANTFLLPQGQTSVVIIMKNNGNGGCGNDLAIDDIEFRACGPTATIGQATTVICPNNAAKIFAIIGAGFSDPYYDWQKYNPTLDTWQTVGVVGLNSNGFDTLDIVTPKNGDQFRYAAAGDSVAMANPFCPTTSDIYLIETLDLDVTVEGIGGSTLCVGDTIKLSGVIPNSTTNPGSQVALAPYDFEWFDPNGMALEPLLHLGITSAIDSIDVFTANFDSSNNIWSVAVEDANGCRDSKDVEIAFAPGCALPVELISFNARVNRAAEVVLTWRTASELNNKGFYVQRSFDGVIWEEVGFVEGSGTTNTLRSYTWVDSKAAQGSVVFYKLKQVDFNGTIEFSESRSVVSGAQANMPVIYPNPADSRLNIHVGVVEEGQEVTVHIVNQFGQSVMEIVNTGVSHYTLDIEELASGMYYAEVRVNGVSFTQKFLKK